MKNKDINFLQSELVRVSSWVEFADKKAGFIGAFYSAIIVFILTQRSQILEGFSSYEGFCSVALILVSFVLLMSVIYGVHSLFCAVLPRLKNENTDKSLFYYGNVTERKIADYLQEMKELTDERVVHQITEQIYANSVIADKKMK